MGAEAATEQPVSETAETVETTAEATPTDTAAESAQETTETKQETAATASLLDNPDSDTEATEDESDLPALDVEALTAGLPEGAVMNDAMLGEFLPVAQELELSQEQTQALVAFQATWTEARRTADAKAIVEDADLGGENLDMNKRLVARGVKNFATPELLAELRASGKDNSPEIFRLFKKLGEFSSEDTLVSPGARQGEPENSLSKMFPSMKDK